MVLQSRPASRSASACPSISAAIAADVNRVALTFPLPCLCSTAWACASRQRHTSGSLGSTGSLPASRSSAREVSCPSARLQRGKHRNSCPVASVIRARVSSRSRSSVRPSGASAQPPPPVARQCGYVVAAGIPAAGIAFAMQVSLSDGSMERTRDARADASIWCAVEMGARPGNQLARRRAPVRRFRRPSPRDRGRSGVSGRARRRPGVDGAPGGHGWSGIRTADRRRSPIRLPPTPTRPPARRRRAPLPPGPRRSVARCRPRLRPARAGRPRTAPGGP
jgi:hypothetical protein